MKKILLMVSLLCITSLPVMAMKDIAGYKWGIPSKVEIREVPDALKVTVKMNQMRTDVYVSNLDCHEYSKTYTLNSTRGYTYVLPSHRAKKEDTKVTDYVKSVFERYKDNIYFVPNGFGLYNYLVGEFYIGNDSLSQHLIQKGFCTRVENEED